MKIRDTLTIAFKNLWRRKMRAFLTVLGMVIGVASIVVMVSLGLGINQVFSESLEGYGDLTRVTVYNSRYYDESESSGGMVMGGSSQVTLDSKVVNNITRLPGVSAVMPVLTVYPCYIKTGQYIANMDIMGVDLEALSHFNISIGEGRLPREGSSSNVEVLLGCYTMQYFYNPRTGRSPVDNQGNSKLSLEYSRFQMTFDSNNVYDYGDMNSGGEGQTQAKGKMYKMSAVGIQSEEGGFDGYYSIMDINALKKLMRENKDFLYSSTDSSAYNEVWVKCKDLETVLEVNEAINQMGFQTRTPLQWVQSSMDTTNQLQMLLGAIGGVALLVAAIGIMNTMLMSIYERTKEIGIIKVLGCRMGNIARLFLTESAYIGLFGGAIGLGISYGISELLNTQVMESVGMRSVIPPWLSLGGVVFSVFVAVVSGMYPALRAMRLSALTAIRSE